MERDQHCETESSSTPQAILSWPQGLTGPTIVYALGGSSEESEEILAFVEMKLCAEERAKRASIDGG